MRGDNRSLESALCGCAPRVPPRADTEVASRSDKNTECVFSELVPTQLAGCDSN